MCLNWCKPGWELGLAEEEQRADEGRAVQTSATAAGAPEPIEEPPMEIHHKPKAVHSWREMLTEVGVIVIGVAIALAGEQTVEALHWKSKVTDAEAAMGHEMSGDLAYAAQQLAMRDCAKKYLARMEMAVTNRRADTLRQLVAMGPPFTTYPWVIESWTAAINSQIPDHIARDRLAAYAVAFRRISTERELQFTMKDHFAEIAGARLTDKPTLEISYAQLAALDKLRAEHGLTLAIATTLLNADGKYLGIMPDAQQLRAIEGIVGANLDPATCERHLKEIGP
jgi:hypothetical protein